MVDEFRKFDDSKVGSNEDRSASSLGKAMTRIPKWQFHEENYDRL